MGLVRPRAPRPLARRHVAAPWIVLGVAWTLALLTGLYAASLGEARDRARFDAAAGDLRAAVATRMEAYVAVLRAGTAFFAGSDSVDPVEFRRFSERLQLTERYPGIQGLGYSVRVRGPREALERRMSAARGEPFKIWPATPRPETHAIVYLEPRDRRNLAAIGFDMSTEPRRREAMERARDTGLAAATGAVTLVQEIDPEKQAGFLIYAPVYAGGGVPASIAERRAALEGFVYAPFRAGDLLETVLAERARRLGFGVRVYAAKSEDAAALLYEGPGGARVADGARRALLPLEVAGRPWTLAVVAGPRFDARPFAGLPLAVTVAGMVVGLVFFALMLGQVRARAAAERAHEELARSEAALRQAQKMEAVGRLAGGVAHDFNNVLTAISGYSELLLGDFAPGDPRRLYAEEIRRAGQRAAAFTRQLLAFGRRQVLAPRVVDLNAVVAQLHGLLRRLIPENIAVEFAPDLSLGHVRVDEGRLAQAIVNLAVNARDAMPNGGRLRLTTRNVETPPATPEGAPERWVELAVSDNGCGMPPDVREHVFEPFFTTKARGKGTGLGLATVYGIVVQSGGRIDVESEPGRGATFRLLFPRIDAPLDAPARIGEAPLRTGSGRILLAEDEAAVRGFAADALRRAGYEVVEAENGARALEVFERDAGSFDLLVTDVVMPGMNGRDLAEELRKRGAALRVLFVSGYTDGAIGEERDLGPGRAFLPKPFSAQTLAAQVSDLLAAPAGGGPEADEDRA
ncbi:CHASE domain-containing protein [bacterium]|nr:CHASE domain-containing protein [bacterium]